MNVALPDDAFDLGADLVELTPFVPPAEAVALREVAYRADAWTAEEVELLVAGFMLDEPIVELVAVLGRPLHGVRSKICELGLRRNSQRPWSELEEAELARRYGDEPASTIAQDLGRAVTAVYARANLLGLSEPSPGPYTEWEQLQVRTGYATGVPVLQISVLIGRTASGIASWASDQDIRHATGSPEWAPEEEARALALAEEGVLYREIARRLSGEGFPDRGHLAIKAALRRLGYGRGWGRAWTPDEDELLRRAYAEGGSLTPLRVRLGRVRHSTQHRARLLGLVHPKPNGFRQGPDWTDAEEAFLVAQYGKIRPAEISAKIGRPIRAVYVKAHHMGLVDRARYSADEKRAMHLAAHHEIRLNDLSHALRRSVGSLSKTIKKMGLSFADPRHQRVKRPDLTLEQILAMEDPDVA